MFILNPLEQFLILKDEPISLFKISLLIPLIYDNINEEWIFTNSLYNKFLYEFIATHTSLGIEYLSFNLLNIQYYKLVLFLVILIVSISLYKIKLFPTTLWQFVIEKSHVVAQSILKPTFGDHYPFTNRFYNYYPFLYYIFLFILFNNLLGLIPYGFSNSAFIIQNFVLSFLNLIGLTLIGIFIQGIYYYKLFVPKNVPVYLIPFLMIIELISHIAKAFSLAIRLFANIMSSHILLHILAGFTIKILNFNTLIGLIPVILILTIVFLEIGIAFLQAYVFTILLTIYFEETFLLLKYQPKLFESDKKPLVLKNSFINKNYN